jgi:protein-tyrosine phosphatase
MVAARLADVHVPVRVCFVCSGNICRSPTAEVVLRSLTERAGLVHLIEIDSAGTGDWHVGDDMDARSRRTMSTAGYAVSSHRAKQFTASMFAARDVVVALDSGHYTELLRLAARADDPEAARRKIVLLRSFDPHLEAGEAPDVADPYYGGQRGFLEVLEQIERSCERLLDELRTASGMGEALRQQTESPPR